MKFNLDSPEFNPLKPAAPVALPVAPTADQTTVVAVPATPDTQPGETPVAAGASPTPDPQTGLNPYVLALAQHGGIYRMLDPNFVAAITQRVAHQQEAAAASTGKRPALAAPQARQALLSKVPFVFTHLADHLKNGNRPYTLDSSLISHLTFPHEGRTYSAKNQQDANPHVPAFMTFSGQFIDHDLTLNPINLFDSQQGTVPSDASPLIDLDSVYGRFEHDNMLAHGTRDDIFTPEGAFRLRQLQDDKGQPVPNAYDLVRDQHGSPEVGDKDYNMYFNKPYMYDLRNDENQMILQIHVLIERVHNKLLAQLTPAEKAKLKNREETIAYVRQEVLNNWQTFVLGEYLPTVVSAEPLQWVLTEICKPGYGKLFHKPDAKDNSLKMPHEFAIGFRMGHSQLRDGYQIRPNDPPIALFINQQVDANDLRGSRPLVLSHVIDWPFFSAPAIPSNKIDRLVTSVVFDLPQSTIPDQVKQVGNLPQRNLIRSSQVELAAGEDLAELYELPAEQRLKPEEVEADPEKRKLFQLDNSGHYHPGHAFRTPLWYYVLQEAGLRTTGKQLGALGGRIVSEVIVGGICYLKDSIYYIPKSGAPTPTPTPKPGWKSKITGTQSVTFADLVKFVTVPVSQPQ